jgi:hypothetical protein
LWLEHTKTYGGAGKKHQSLFSFGSITCIRFEGIISAYFPLACGGEYSTPISLHAKENIILMISKFFRVYISGNDCLRVCRKAGFFYCKQFIPLVREKNKLAIAGNQ